MNAKDKSWIKEEIRKSYLKSSNENTNYVIAGIFLTLVIVFIAIFFIFTFSPLFQQNQIPSGYEEYCTKETSNGKETINQNTFVGLNGEAYFRDAMGGFGNKIMGYTTCLDKDWLPPGEGWFRECRYALTKESVCVEFGLRKVIKKWLMVTILKN